MEELIPINIVIADRTYRVKANPKDEEKIRNNTKSINNKIIEFKNQFPAKDMQDYVAMVLIWNTTQTSGSANENLSKEFNDILERIESQIDKVL